MPRNTTVACAVTDGDYILVYDVPQQAWASPSSDHVVDHNYPPCHVPLPAVTKANNAATASREYKTAMSAVMLTAGRAEEVVAPDELAGG